MSVTGKRGIGIPTILLHDAEGCIVTIELKNGDVYVGYLDESEDNMNITLRDSIKTDAAGKQSKVEMIYIRGSQILFIVMPDMLQKAPMFRRVVLWKKHRGAMPTLGAGDIAPRGQAAAILRKAQSRRGGFGGGRGRG